MTTNLIQEQEITAAHTVYLARTVATECGYECRLHERLSAGEIDHHAAAIGTGDTPEESIEAAQADLLDQWNED